MLDILNMLSSHLWKAGYEKGTWNSTFLVSCVNLGGLYLVWESIETFSDGVYSEVSVGFDT